MTRINTNVASLRGLRNLDKASNLLGTSLQRLSTGLKINSGKDNPSGLIASETLRSQITVIEQSIKNSNRANNVIGTADAALGEIGGLLNQVRGLVQEGLNNGALSQQEIEANQLQIDAALSAINRIASNTSFAGDRLIDGSKAFTTELTAADAAELDDFQINEALFGSSNTIEVAAEVTTLASKGTLLYTDGDLTANTTLEIQGSSGSEVLFFSDSTNLDDVADAINAVSDATGVEASITTAAVAGTLDIDETDLGTDTITFTEKRVGTGVDDVVVNLVNGGASQALSVAVTGVGTGTATITINLETDGLGVSTTTGDDIVAAIAADEDASALVTAAMSAGTGNTAVFDGGDPGDGGTVDTGRVVGELTLASLNYGEDEFVRVNVLSGSFATEDEDANAVASDAGTDIGVVINGQAALGKGLKASIRTSTLDASLSFAEASNTVGTTTTVTITGGGSLFQIGQEATASGQIGVGIEAVNTARLGGLTGKLYELGSTGGKSLLDVGPDVQGSDLVKIVEEALDRVSTLRGRLGALQKNVIETNITSLGVALENITEARSQIVDTDFAEETANLTKGQILSQAGISVLSIANQSPSQVLALLG